MRRRHDCRRRPRRSNPRMPGSVFARAVSFVEIDARTPEEIAPSIHLRWPRARAFVRSFCEIAGICAQHHHHLPARPNNWQWLYPPEGGGGGIPPTHVSLPSLEETCVILIGNCNARAHVGRYVEA